MYASPDRRSRGDVAKFLAATGAFFSLVKTKKSAARSYKCRRRRRGREKAAKSASPSAGDRAKSSLFSVHCVRVHVYILYIQSSLLLSPSLLPRNPSSLGRLQRARRRRDSRAGSGTCAANYNPLWWAAALADPALLLFLSLSLFLLLRLSHSLACLFL